MCFSLGITAVMTATGAASTLMTARRGDALAIPVTLGWFTLMEGLQLWGYSVLDTCGSPSNQIVTLLSVLHIAFQPLFINAFIMATVAPVTSPGRRVLVFALAGLASAVMLVQIYPIQGVDSCAPGSAMCAKVLCTRAGEWHLAWDVPLNGVLNGLDWPPDTHWGMPTYILGAFVLPICYGAWRFALFHALIGPILARQLTADPGEWPAIWCLFSIGIILTALAPPARRLLSAGRALAASGP